MLLTTCQLIIYMSLLPKFASLTKKLRLFTPLVSRSNHHWHKRSPPDIDTGLSSTGS